MKMLAVKSAASSSFLGVDWGSIALVFVVALVVVVVVVALYSTGLVLLASGESRQTRSPLATAGAWVCIGIGAIAVLYGVYLVIPLFHQ